MNADAASGQPVQPPDVPQSAAGEPAQPAWSVSFGLPHLSAAVRDKLARFLAGGHDSGSPTAGPPLGTRDGAVSQGEIRAAVEASRRAFVAAGLFSLIINLLMLTGPLFMLQVYDRVMTSGSLPTLVVLTLITASLYAVIGVFELVRTRIIVRAAVEIDRRLGGRILRASLRRSGSHPGAPMPALRELDNIRQFVAGPGPVTFFDAPWTPIYLVVVFMLHWTLGVVAALGAATLLLVAWSSESSAREPLAEVTKATALSVDMAESGQRNAEALLAMGMVEAYRARWQTLNDRALSWQILAADRLGTASAVSKTLRLLLQSLMLAVGAALAISGEISAGAIVAATITFGRALAPVEQALGQWRPFVRARESYARLETLLREVPEPPRRTALPAPKGFLAVQDLKVAAPSSQRLLVANLSFFVKPGQMLAVIGPSASGKSTLARAIVGLWPSAGGSIRLDGARLDQWDPDELGRHVGYLPQSVELFSGTVRENISRFRTDASDEALVEAARMAHAHDLILALPNGYDTQLGSFGTHLSAGQRQRIGLARALFDRPALVVLDEPNANLDRDGDEALTAAIAGLRKRGQAIVLISHRVQAIAISDLILVLDRGLQRAFGPRDEVMRILQGGAEPRPVQAGSVR